MQLVNTRNPAVFRLELKISTEKKAVREFSASVNHSRETLLRKKWTRLPQQLFVTFSLK